MSSAGQFTAYRHSANLISQEHFDSRPTDEFCLSAEERGAISMKICPECHRLSRDDDFCSRCGAAVYGDDDYSDPVSISCESDRTHSHKQETFTDNRYKDRPVINGSAYKGAAPRNSSPERKRKGSPLTTLIIIIILFFVFGDILTMLFAVIAALFS